jgi:hypothetical protein
MTCKLVCDGDLGACKICDHNEARLESNVCPFSQFRIRPTTTYIHPPHDPTTAYKLKSEPEYTFNDLYKLVNQLANDFRTFLIIVRRMEPKLMRILDAITVPDENITPLEKSENGLL